MRFDPNTTGPDAVRERITLAYTVRDDGPTGTGGPR